MKTILSLFLFLAICEPSFCQEEKKDIEQHVVEEEIYTIVEQMPEFSGGQEALMNYLKDNLKYPAKSLKKKIQGTVYVTFVIDANGKVVNPQILRGVSEDIDAEALRVVKNMPNWIPGKQRGKQVTVQFNLPLRFTL